MDRRSLNFLLLVSHIIVLALPAVMILMDVPVLIVLTVMTFMISTILFFIRARLKSHYKLIAKAARRFADGEYSARVPSMGLDEFQQLGMELNAMLGKLDSTIGQLAVHREELRLVLGSIEDVLWSTDYDGFIQWTNAAFRSLFPNYEADSRTHFRELFVDPDLLQRVSDSPEAPQNQALEVRVGDHSYILSVSRNFTARRKVFILHNIDALTQAARMKKDFIANLAHELRTPLTAIKGFTEALSTAPDTERDRYQSIIRAHTDRLIHLVSDLAQLISLESVAAPQFESISLPTFFANIRLILDPEVQAKGLEPRVFLGDDLPRVDCDPYKLEQVFINLVHNSLRHTEVGSISIRATLQDQQVLFEVEDTGEGIPEEYLDRVFERFFVADPSRNKGKSGSGLGLAIVKHIVLLHRGSISVASTPGKGTCFTILLPRTQPRLGKASTSHIDSSDGS